MPIGKKLREFLKIQGMKEHKLAEYLGISAERSSDYPHGKRERDIDTPDKRDKRLSAAHDGLTGDPQSIREHSCEGLTIGFIEDMLCLLSNHHRLADYLACNICELSTETLDDKDIYAYALGLSSDRIEKLCHELDDHILTERRRILEIK